MKKIKGTKIHHHNFITISCLMDHGKRRRGIEGGAVVEENRQFLINDINKFMLYDILFLFFMSQKQFTFSKSIIKNQFNNCQSKTTNNL